VIYGYWEEPGRPGAGRLAVRLVNHLVKREKDLDFRAELERLILLAERRAFGRAPGDRGRGREPRHPVDRLNEASLVQLGGAVPTADPGTMTSKTSALAVDIAGDKDMTRRLLASAGLPVPRERSCRDEDAAWRREAESGSPS